MDSFIDNIIYVLIGVIIPSVGVWLFNLFRNRTRIHRIRNKRDGYFSQFASLFDNDGRNGIRPELREPSDEVGEWLNEYEADKKECTLIPFLLVLIRERKVIGFFYFEFSSLSHCLYIGFLGRDEDRRDEMTDDKVTERFARKFWQLFKKHMAQCELILFEVDDENDPALDWKIRRKAEVKKRLFGRVVGKLTETRKKPTHLYEIGIDYYQPTLVPSRDQGVKQDLLFVPLNGDPAPGDLSISKARLQKILDFLFKESYASLGDNYLGKDYRAIVEEQYRNIIASTPDRVPLKQLTRVSRRDG